MSKLSVQTLTKLGLLSAAALALYELESLIPPPVPIPGVKPGFANIVTLVTLCAYGPGPAALVAIVRVLLAAVIAGNAFTLAYSATGACLALLSMWLCNKFLRGRWVCISGCVGGLAHNAGQLAVACLVTRSTAACAYAPVLAIAGIATGAFNGLCAAFTLRIMRRFTI